MMPPTYRLIDMLLENDVSTRCCIELSPGSYQEAFKAREPRLEDGNESGQVVEVAFRDIWPKGFSEFHDTWKRRKGRRDLYVRFDNGTTTDVLHGGASPTPTHHDPKGVYAYPLAYVIDYPGDIWYGHNSRFLQVIQDVSRRKVVLSDMTYDQANALLRRGRISTDLTTVAKYFPDRAKGITAPGKLFMAAVQMDFSNADTPKNIRIKQRRGEQHTAPVQRSSEEQAATLKKMGIDAIEDDARTISQASVNDREPQQICWLTPRSFKVLEVFRLADPVKHASQVVLDTERILLKVAALLSQAMGDKLVSGRDPHKDYTRYWTKGGRLITLQSMDASLDWRMKHLQMGQKKHKMHRKHDRTAIQGTVQSERGSFTILIANDESIQGEVTRFANNWQAKEGEDDGARFSKAEYVKAQELARQAYQDATEAENQRKLLDLWPVFTEHYNAAAEHYGLPPLPLLNDEQKVHTDRKSVV